MHRKRKRKIKKIMGTDRVWRERREARFLKTIFT